MGQNTRRNVVEQPSGLVGIEFNGFLRHTADVGKQVAN